MPSVLNSSISCPNYTKAPPQVHPSIGWPDLLLKTSKLHVADNSQVDRISLFIFNYSIIRLLFNYTKCLNIVRTFSKTFYCTLRGYFPDWIQLDIFYRIFPELQIVRDSLSRLFIRECCFLQSLLLNKHYLKPTELLCSLCNKHRSRTQVLFCPKSREERERTLQYHENFEKSWENDSFSCCQYISSFVGPLMCWMPACALGRFHSFVRTLKVF